MSPRFSIKLLFFPAIFIAAACNVINPDEEIPSYVQVEAFEVYTDMETQGTASSNFADEWITVDGIFLGGYPLGTRVPVLYNGTHKVSVSAGILLNGIEGTRVPYAPMQIYDTVLDLRPGVIHKLTPVITYNSSAVFPLIEDFDHTSFQFNTPITSAALSVENNSFENDGGIVILEQGYPQFECTSIDSFDLPGGGEPAFVEINYKCNTEFLVGVKANTSLGDLDFPLLNIRETDTWKKIYVNLTAITTQAQGATDWRVYFKASLASGHTSDTLRFDNIKLVY